MNSIKITTIKNTNIFIINNLQHTIFRMMSASTSTKNPLKADAPTWFGGYDKDGFDYKGFDPQGFDRDGFNKFGFGRDGFNKFGFNLQGYDREGYDHHGFDEDGYDREGFDEYGYDKDGFDKDGFDPTGYDCNGQNYEGRDCNGNFEREIDEDEDLDDDLDDDLDVDLDDDVVDPAPTTKIGGGASAAIPPTPPGPIKVITYRTGAKTASSLIFENVKHNIESEFHVFGCSTMTESEVRKSIPKGVSIIVFESKVNKNGDLYFQIVVQR